MVNPGEVRRRAALPVSIGMVAASDEAYKAMEEFLIPPGLPADGRWALRESAWRANDPEAPGEVDIQLYEEGLPRPRGAFVFRADAPSRTVEEIVVGNPDLELALAQRFPVFRARVVERLIRAVSQENALFAVATALPDAIPSLAELPWSFGEFASDTAFITANQLRMAFQLAAAHGKPVGYIEQKTELAAIAAGAFGWRAMARELVGKIPFGGGLIPKGAIAFAATYAIGKGLAHLYGTGAPMGRVERKRLYREAHEEASQASYNS
jgi:uncharacterized protein (DUF697 family)